MTWGTPPVHKNNIYRAADPGWSFLTTNISDCRAACVERDGQSGSAACKYLSFLPYKFMDTGKCVLSTGKFPEKQANGYIHMAVDAPLASPPIGEYYISTVDEATGGLLELCPDDTCSTIFDYTNPKIELSSPDMEATQIYSGLVASDVLTPFLHGKVPKYHLSDVADEFIMQAPRKSCQRNLFKAGSSFVGFATSKTDATIQFFKFDPRLRLLDNTLDSPADISGLRNASVFGHSGGEAQCPLVAPNFVNRGKCVRHTEGTCSPLEFLSQKTVKLDRTNLRLWYTTSNKMVYAVDGLTAEDSPCTPHLRSRWRLLPGTCQGGPTLDVDTQKTLLEALKKHDGICNTMFSRLPEDERSYSSLDEGQFPGYKLAKSQIDSSQSWYAGVDQVGEWLQFNFGTVQTVAGVAVQGIGANKPYVKKYKVQRSLDGKNWIDVPGEYDATESTDVQVSYLPAPVSAQYVRLVVTDFVNAIRLRADLLLCRPGSGQNSVIRDVVVSDMTNGKCSTSSSTIGAMIQFDQSTCWQHVHPDTLNVYDFSDESLMQCFKVFRRNDINALAETGSHIYRFTDYHRRLGSKWGGVWDWPTFRDSKLTTKYVGRFGDSVLFQNLDTDLQTLPMADALGVKSSASTVAFEACGSRGEVKNNPLLGNLHFIIDAAGSCKYLFKRARRAFEFTYVDFERAKEYIHTNVMLKAADQLRHRVAWAISQILVVSQQVNLFRRDR